MFKDHFGEFPFNVSWWCPSDIVSVAARVIFCTFFTWGYLSCSWTVVEPGGHSVKRALAFSGIHVIHLSLACHIRQHDSGITVIFFSFFFLRLPNTKCSDCEAWHHLWVECRSADSDLGSQLGLNHLPPSTHWLVWNAWHAMETVGSTFTWVSALSLQIHLGYNYSPHISAAEFTDVIMEGHSHISQRFWGATVAWVDLLPWKVWHGAIKPKAVDTSRCKVNRTMHEVMQWNGSSVRPVWHLFWPAPPLQMRCGTSLFWRMQYLIGQFS